MVDEAGGLGAEAPSALCTVPDGELMKSGGVELYYEVLGGGDATPLVVLNGGPGVDHTYMHCSDVWDRLAERRPVLMYDPRGTGRSARLEPGQSCTYPDQLADLAALLDHLGWRRVDLLGHSFGGNVAMGFSARSADRVRRLVLVDSGDPKDPEASFLFAELYPDVYERWRACDFAERLGDEDARRESFLLYNSMLYYSPERREAFMRRVTGDGLVYDVNASVWEDVKRYDLWPVLPKLRLPVLVITGRYDANVAPRVSYGIHKAIPGSRFVVFEKSGHKPFYEEPEAFEALVEEFLA